MEWLYILLFITGLVILLKGADVITNYASRIARALGVSEMVIGITLVAIATSLPELAVCVTSAFTGVASMAIGTIVGSNIANVALVFALSALAAPFITKRIFLKEGYFMLAFSFLAAFLILGGLFWFEGFVLIVIALVYMAWLVKNEKKKISKKKKTGMKETECKIKYIVFCLIGGAAVVVGAHLIVTSTIEIARWFGVSELLISLIIIAIGTSLPELATSVTAARKGMRGISLGNIIGSNIFNLMILGISSLVAVSPITRGLILINIPIMLIVSILLVFFIKSEWKVSKKEAILFLGIYALFIALQFISV